MWLVCVYVICESARRARNRTDKDNRGAKPSRAQPSTRVPNRAMLYFVYTSPGFSHLGIFLSREIAPYRAVS